MLSMTNVTAGQAGTYYQKDSYYTQKEYDGQWVGKGAEAFGLAGGITKEAFTAVINGLDPNTGRQLIVDGRTPDGEPVHRAGTDLTFSAPKSVSVLHGLGIEREAIQNAHDAAVRMTLDYAEKNFAACRIKTDGRAVNTPTGNFVAAVFRHETSRELDPQLHSHCVVANMTQDKDGKWRAVDNSDLFKNKMALGQIYRNELANGLRAAGLAVESDHRGLFEVKGVPQGINDHFSRRAAQIAEAMVELREKYPNVTEAKLKEMAALGSREAKKDVDMEAVKASWNARLQNDCHHSKEGLAGAVTAAGALSETKDRDMPHMSMDDAVRMAVKTLSETEAVFTRAAIIAQAAKLDLGRNDIVALEGTIDKLTGKGEIVRLSDRGHCSTAEMVKLERETLDHVKTGKASVEAVMTDKDAAKALAKEYSHLSAGQAEAVKLALTSTDRILAVQGDAGTGKTTMMKVLQAKAEKNGHVVFGMSYTHKAVAEMRGVGLNADTLHAFLGKVERGDVKVVSAADHDKARAEYADIYKKLGGDKALADLQKPVTDVDLAKIGRHEMLKGFGWKAVDALTWAKGKTHNESVHGNSVNWSTRNRVGDFFREIGRHVTEQYAGASTVTTRSGDTFKYVNHAGQRDIEHLKTYTEIRRMAGGHELNSYTMRADGTIHHYQREQFKAGMAVANNESSREIAKPQNVLVEGRAKLVVDEASFAGVKQFHQLLSFAEKHKLQVVSVGDVKQHQAISAGRVLDNFMRHGAATAIMSDNKRQKDPIYRDIVDHVAKREMGIAFDKMQAHGVIREHAGRGDIVARDVMLGAMASSYVAAVKDGKSALAVVTTNVDRVKLNNSIRDDLKAAGALKGEDRHVRVRDAVNIGESDKKFAHAYNPALHKDKGDLYLLDRKGDAYKVTGIDREKHTVQAEGKAGKVDIDVRKDGGKYSTFAEESKGFQPGDKVIFTKTDRQLGVSNNMTGTVKEVGQDGSMKVGVGEGKDAKDVTLDAGADKYINHGYAVTSFKSQGQTVDKVIAAEASNYNGYYVNITRGRDSAEIHTTDFETMKAAAECMIEKTSTVDFAKDESKTAVDHVPQSANHGEQVASRDEGNEGRADGKDADKGGEIEEKANGQEGRDVKEELQSGEEERRGEMDERRDDKSVGDDAPKSDELSR